MSLRKAVLALGLMTSLIIPAVSQAGFETRERNIPYQIEYQRLRWYERLFAWVIGQYDFLKWKELNIKELSIKDPALQDGEIILLSVTPKGRKEALYLRNGGEKIWGYINLIKYEEYQKEQVRGLMAAYNYLYIAEEGKSGFIVPNLFGKGKTGLMRMIIAKKKAGEKFLILIEAFDETKKLGFVKIIMNPQSPKTFENIEIELEKERVRVIMTIQKPAQ